MGPGVSAAAGPLPVGLPVAAQALLEQSRTATTPCGDGVMVWRCWGDGIPVVLLHGGSGSWTHWLRNIPALLAVGRQVWAPDLPGFGDSATPPGGSDADAVLAPLAMGLRQVLGPASHEIVAFSFGSLVAVLLAAQQPSLASRLLLVGLPVLPLVHGRGVALPSMRATLSPEERAAAQRANLAAIMIHDPLQIGDDTVALQMANAASDRMRARQLVTTDACARAVRALQCDFECVWGEQDVLCRDRWAEVRAVCNLNPLCAHQTLIASAGHWVQYEKAESFNSLLTTWAGHPSGCTAIVTED
jgi:2-hydroxy-6-oxonona-2,4-dienedioate hydrolase